MLQVQILYNNFCEFWHLLGFQNQVNFSDLLENSLNKFIYCMVGNRNVSE